MTDELDPRDLVIEHLQETNEELTRVVEIHKELVSAVDELYGAFNRYLELTYQAGLYLPYEVQKLWDAVNRAQDLTE